MSRDDKIDQLQQVGLFSTCTPKELRHIAALTDEVQVPAGTVLCTQGRTARECFVVIEGEAEVRIGDRAVGAVGPGETVGEMALIDHQPRSATVVARTPMRLYVIEVQRFDGLLEDVPIVARRILAGMSRRLRVVERVAG